MNAPDPPGMKAVMANANLPTAQPEQIAEVALFLASEASNAINGEVIVADRGWSAR
ncbi:SDR family oxidoreductase [Pluralibacter gergoviae]|uniref:SDR family oxidoreductase n=1 Tax=Pluralibacter gergoviae TaxID=61647 RepID=UPI0012D3BC02|nr:SDR family oxidoreductase [Pluralibacter gergoviae]